MSPISNEISVAYYFDFVRSFVRSVSVRPIVMLSCACHIFRTLPAKVLKFNIHGLLIPARIFFLCGIFVFSELCPFIQINK